MERYLIVLKSYKRIPIELKQILRENVTPIKVRKHDIIQPIGTFRDNLYFVEKGLFQLYTDRHGKQITLRFKKEDEFIVCLKELFPNEKEDGYGIEALEDGLLWQFSGPLVTQLTEKYPQFLFQFRIILTKDWLSVDQAKRCSRPEGGSDNYDALCEYSPELLDRVPIRYLANYTEIPEKVFRHLRYSKIKLNISTTRWRKS